MLCLLDNDDVIVDFKRGVQELLKIPQSVFDEAKKPMSWDWIWSITQFDRDKFWSMIDADWWAKLHWTIEGPEILQMVEEFFGEINVCLLTSPTQQESGYTGKFRWVKKNLPRYTKRVLIGCSKYFVAGPGKVLIDDREYNVDQFIACGGKGILVPRPWNRLHMKTDILGHIGSELERIRIHES